MRRSEASLCIYRQFTISIEMPSESMAIEWSTQVSAISTTEFVYAIRLSTAPSFNPPHPWTGMVV